MTKIVDGNGTPIEVGSLVEDDGFYATVIEITDDDGDVDDEGRGIYIPRYVVVQYHDCVDRFPCTTQYPYQDEWVCDDVKVLVAQEAAS